MLTNASNFDKGLRQPGDQPHCFELGTKLINVGVGFGGYQYYGSWGGYRYSSTPALSVSYEQAWPKKLGPGFLGVGAYVGFKHAQSRYEDYYIFGERYYYEHNWNHFVAAARGVYHWDVLNAKNAEVYGGVLLGFRVTTYSYKTNSPSNSYSYKRSDGGLAPVASVFAGARWYFVPKVALFAEVGYGISYLTGGCTFKF